jgi:hypothetical protein
VRHARRSAVDAGDALVHVKAATLLIVGGDDEPVIELNRLAKSRMRCETRLEIIPGATHLFEEPGALDRVAVPARDFFLRHMPRAAQSGPTRAS